MAVNAIDPVNAVNPRSTRPDVCRMLLGIFTYTHRIYIYIYVDVSIFIGATGRVPDAA